MNDPIAAFGVASGTEWAALSKAREEASAAKQHLFDLLSEFVSPEDTSVVVFGSMARGEKTSGSDVDWTLLIDGQASSTHFEVAREIGRVLKEEEKKGPGREATFAGLAFSHEILHRIGGGEDTNRNLTQRILLILESAAIGPDAAYGRVVRAVLDRYITEDPGWESKVVNVPRFLLNDVSRYWRTVAVDFAYKRRERAAEGWALRTVKLRLSRKLTYASGLLACFSCATEKSVLEADDSSKAVIEHLVRLVASTPLERLTTLLQQSGLSRPAERLLTSYDQFLAMLDDAAMRDELEKLAPEDAGQNAVYQQARDVGHEFQSALNEIFFGPESPFRGFTQRYGVF
ncbi:MAG TPA: nucleotidyltransferase domain-containing protein [Longimicrobium sp.]|jgi:predicted nucleotidyltransferase